MSLGWGRTLSLQRLDELGTSNLTCFLIRYEMHACYGVVISGVCTGTYLFDG